MKESEQKRKCSHFTSMEELFVTDEQRNKKEVRWDKDEV